jgi:hypothetical protein
MDPELTLVTRHGWSVTDFSKFQRIIEHMYIHNITRLEVQVSAGHISPSENDDLRSLWNGRMIEAGKFYEEPIHGIIVAHPSPFCLNLY